MSAIYLVPAALGLLLKNDHLATSLATLLGIPITALTCLIVYRCARRLGYGWSAGLGVALLYGLATLAWVYSRSDQSEPLLALCYILAAYSLFHRQPARGNYLQAGLWLGVAALTKPTGLLVLPAVLVYLWWRNRASLHRLFSALLWTLIPVAVSGIALILWNIYRFGTVFETGYGALSDQFAPGSIWEGLFGILVSPGKSIFLYAPGLVLAVCGARRFARLHQAEAIFGAALAATYVGFFVRYWNWEGDWAWGPRYVMPVVPLLILFAAPVFQRSRPRRAWSWHRRWLIRVVFALGIIVNLLGMLVNVYNGYTLNALGKTGQDWRFVPDASPLRVQAIPVASAARRALGMERLTLDYYDWDPGRVHAQRHVLPLDLYTLDLHTQGTVAFHYDSFDVLYLAPLTPQPGEESAPTAALLGLPLLALALYGGLRLRRTAQHLARPSPHRKKSQPALSLPLHPQLIESR